MIAALSVVLIVVGVVVAAVVIQTLGALLVVAGVLALIISLLGLASSNPTDAHEDVESGVNDVRMRHQDHV